MPELVVSAKATASASNDGRLRAIEFNRIKGGKAFDVSTPWFEDLLSALGQPKGAEVAAR